MRLWLPIEYGDALVYPVKTYCASKRCYEDLYHRTYGLFVKASLTSLPVSGAFPDSESVGEDLLVKDGALYALVLRPINTMMYADGACEARSRQEEEDDAWPSLTTTNAEIVHNPHLPSGWRRDGPMALSLLLHDTRHRVRRRFAPSTPSRSPHTSSYLWDGARVPHNRSHCGQLRVFLSAPRIRSQSGECTLCSLKKRHDPGKTPGFRSFATRTPGICR